MLHRINLPACTEHLGWIVKLQSDLLHALCDPTVAADAITVDWIKARRPDIDEGWLNRFCTWSRDGRSVLERMKAIAGLMNADKKALIAHYETNIRYPEAFNANQPPPPATTPLPDGLSSSAVSAYRDFFELFYSPIFYRDKGYPINASDLNGEPFTKDKFLKAYHDANPDLRACPLCDGSMDGAELDHWLAKKYLPELNCHPQNLVEICGACNSRTHKGEKLTLDAGKADPFDNWFHPHLRSASGQFDIRIDDEVPMLVSDDSVAQARLSTFNELINLTKRWSEEYRWQLKGVNQRIRNHRRWGRKFDEQGLRAQIESWRIDAEGEKGFREHKLLEERLLAQALEEGSDIFIELLTYSTDRS